MLAKSLNCTMRPPTIGDPCGACDSCRAIDNGSFIDLIEVDAASNRGIDEIRDLREKVRFAPTVGRNKVYIIDEAHALTNDAFNAFLKTLEEPPPHSVFVLATTEPERLPPTIVSRCQRFDFHRIAMQDMTERLAGIAQEEGVEVSPEVLRLIGRASGGSLRDGTNLLDQLITSFGSRVTVEQARELLGISGEESALALVKHLLTGNTGQALEVINGVANEGVDLRPLHRMTVELLRAALLIKSSATSCAGPLQGHRIAALVRREQRAAGADHARAAAVRPRFIPVRPAVAAPAGARRGRTRLADRDCRACSRNRSPGACGRRAPPCPTPRRRLLHLPVRQRPLSRSPPTGGLRRLPLLLLPWTRRRPSTNASPPYGRRSSSHSPVCRRTSLRSPRCSAVRRTGKSGVPNSS